MPSKFLKLQRAALAVPFNTNWRPQVLGAGSIVERIPEADWLLALPPEGVTTPPLETDFAVRFQDAAARQAMAWISDRALSKASGGPLLRVPFHLDGDDVDSMDWLREQASLAGLDVRRWLIVHGKKYRNQLFPVARELGIRTKSADDADVLIRRILRQLLNREVSMAEVQATRERQAKSAPAKKATSKQKAKAKANGRAVKESSNGEGRASAGESVGTVLVPLLSGKANAAARKLAQSLADGDSLTGAQLTRLRDAINEAAADARAENKRKVADALSAANRLVRRLVRSA